MTAPRPQVLFETRQQWREWLIAHHSTSQGIWLVRWKKTSGHPHLAYDDVVDEALCFGWVDSQPRKLDEERSQLLLTPRRRGSSWSAVNKARIDRLTRDGLMSDAGLASVAAAQADGSWSAIDGVETLAVPDDLTRALDAVPVARTEWDAFPRSTRRAILEWLHSARTEATRTTRVERIVSDAEQGIRANQWRQPTGKKATPKARS